MHHFVDLMHSRRRFHANRLSEWNTVVPVLKINAVRGLFALPTHIPRCGVACGGESSMQL